MASRDVLGIQFWPQKLGPSRNCDVKTYDLRLTCTYVTDSHLKSVFNFRMATSVTSMSTDVKPSAYRAAVAITRG